MLDLLDHAGTKRSTASCIFMDVLRVKILRVCMSLWGSQDPNRAGATGPVFTRPLFNKIIMIIIMRDASTSAGSAAYAAECRKHEANDTKCQELGWTCIPLAVETFGHWGKEAQAVFSRLASFIAIHRASPKSSVLNEMYSRLNMSLVRSVARAILVRGSAA